MHLVATKKFLSAFFVFFAFQYAGFAQLSVSGQKFTEADGAITFEVSGASAGNVAYEIRHSGKPNYLPILVNGNVTANGSGQATIGFTPTEAGVYFCSINQNGNSANFATAYKPFQIPLFGENPSDFPEFWQGQRDLLAAVPLDVQLESLSSNEYIQTWRISLAMFDGQKAYGYITVPVGGGIYPALIQLPPFGSNANIVIPNTEMATRSGVIVVNLNIHPNPPDQQGPLEYATQGMFNANTFYYKHAVVAVSRIIDYLETRSDYNGKVGVFGDSQGGGLAMLAAGADTRISVLMQSVAALGAQAASVNDLPAGFPDYYNLCIDQGLDANAILESVKYYDSSIAMQYFNGVSFNALGYKDDVCAPGSIFSAMNSSSGTHMCLHMYQAGHSNPQEFVDYNALNGISAFLRRQWPETQSPPWPWPQTTLGFWLNAGEDKILAQPSSVLLDAKAWNENQINTTWPIRWRMVSGPSAVTFSNPASASPLLTVSNSGAYLLECMVYVNDYGTDRYYTLQDYVTVYVGGDVQDVTKPTIQLIHNGAVVEGPFVVDVILSEPIIGLTLSDFILSNCLGVQLVPSGVNYKLTINPLGSGAVSIQVPANVATDLNDNQNESSNVLTLTYSPCTLLPNGGQILGDETGCDDFDPSVITSSSVPVGASNDFFWQKSTVGPNGPWIEIQGANSDTYNPGPLGVSTWFRRLAKAASCISFTVSAPSNIVFKEVEACGQGICAISTPVQSENFANQWLSFVKLNGKEVITGKSAYTDLTDTVFTIAVGQVSDLEFAIGYLFDTYESYLNVWADLNRDNAFNEPDERIAELYLQAPPAGTPLFFTNTFFVLPENTPSGPMRMRISLNRADFIGPCENPGFGEVEDYTLNVLSEGDSSGVINKPFAFVRPNPAGYQTELVWDIEKGAPDAIWLSDATGRILELFTVPALPDNTLQVEVSNYPVGIYYLYLSKSPEAPFSIPILVQR